MKKAKHQLDLIGNPYHVDEKHNLVFDTEYDYAIHLVKKIMNTRRISKTNLSFLLGVLAHGKNAELQMRKNRMERKALREYQMQRFGVTEVRKDATPVQ